MTFDLVRSIQVLERTPSMLCAWLSGLSNDWVKSNYGEATFSPFDVVGHLIHGERTDWLPRARLILEHGDAKAFEPFDRYAMYEESQGKTIEELLDTFAMLRQNSLADLRALNLTEELLKRPGRHPALGQVTMKQLLATWVVHDLNHLHQIAKSMAYQYRDEVGPWREYLSILPKVTEGT